MFEKLKEINRMKEDYERKMKKEGKAALEEAFQDLFKKHSNLIAVKWHQWIPGFNDGDPCTFTTGECYLSIEGIEVKDSESGDDAFTSEWEIRNNPVAVETFTRISNDVSKFWQRAPEDLLEALFGSNAEITVTRKGIEVSDYDCGY